MSGPFGSSQWMYNSGGDFYGYEIDNSLRFNDNDSAYLSRTPASAGNRKTWTWSGWVKRGNFTPAQYVFFAYNGNSDAGFFRIEFNSTNTIRVRGWGTTYLETSALYRDTSAWYHIVLVADTTQSQTSSTASDSRIRLYVNGEQVTAFSSSSMPSQNTDLPINNNIAHAISGQVPYGTGAKFDGYLAEINFIDGQALDPTSFGETKSGIWIPKAYSGSYGTNGFYLDFADSGNLGDDESGNGNDFSTSGLAATDQVLDSPTNNYTTLLPTQGGPAHTYSEGSLRVYSGPSGYDHNQLSNPWPSSGKWYSEVLLYDIISNDPPSWGIGLAPFQTSMTTYPGGDTSNGYGYGLSPGSQTVSIYTNGAYTGTTYSSGHNFTAGVTVVQAAFDADTGKFWLGVNNTWKNHSGTTADPSTGSNPSVTLTAAQQAMDFTLSIGRLTNDSGRYTTVHLNSGQDGTFAGAKTAGGNSDANGQGNFIYSPPTDFLAMCSANFPDPAIDPAQDDTPGDYFNTALYTGTGATLSITGVGFQPDWVWMKRRSSSANPTLVDAVRGVTKTLESTTTGAEETQAQSLQSFDSDGFTIGSRLQDNQSGGTYVAWNWKAGGSGSSNSDGSITTTVSNNPDSGFSIIKYTGNGTNGATIGHGLGATPDHIIIKRYSSAEAWVNWNTGFSGTQYLRLYQANAVDTATTLFNSTLPNSSVITLGTGGFTNTSGEDYICYAFTEKEGYSKFGSYTGNGSTDGPFIYTGFRPAWILFKNASATEAWQLIDSERSPYNVANAVLYPNSSAAESNPLTAANTDFLSNGFKIRAASGNTNDSGLTYIYLAFAEQPFKYANAR